MTFARRSVAPLAIIFVASLSTTAHAEPTAEDLATARDLFKEGRALREQGDLPKALEKLRAAHALGQTPITGIELARTYVLVGRLVDAHEVSLGVARLPIANDETERSATARTDAAKLAIDLAPRLAQLIVTVKGLSPGSEPRITVDGELVPLAAVREPRRTDPGKHLVVLTLASGAEVRALVEVSEGESRAVVFDATPPPQPSLPSPVAAPSTAVLPPEAPPPRRSKALLISGAVATGLGVTLGTAFGIATLKAKGSLATDCRNGLCGPMFHSELESARTDGTIATVAFVVAGAGLGAVILDLLLRPAARDARVSVVPEIGAHSVWVGAHASF